MSSRIGRRGKLFGLVSLTKYPSGTLGTAGPRRASPGGGTAGLHLVRLDHGSSIANAVARRLVVPPHWAGGQAQFVTTPVPAQDDHPFAALFPGSSNGLTSR
jgi:hypothetical protein